MKKQSVYAHYKSKEDIFLSVLDQVLMEEEEFLSEYFAKEYSSPAECFDGFITKIKERFSSDKEDNIRFILRTSYMPPEKLIGEVSPKCHGYFQMIELMIRKVIAPTASSKDELCAKVLAMATLIDGLFSALLYCGTDVLEQKQKACYRLFTEPVYGSHNTGKESV